MESVTGFYSFGKNEVPIDESQFSGNAIRHKGLFMHASKPENVAEVNGIVVAFEGVIYNLAEIMPSYESPASSLAQLYETLGTKFIEKLDAKASIFIIDTRKKILIIIRDELGQKPIFYSRNENIVAFASRQRDLISKLMIEPKIKIKSLYSYLYYGYVPSPESLVENIAKVPSSHLVTFRDSGMEAVNYWQLSYRSKSPETIDDLATRLEEMIKLSLTKSVQGKEANLLLSGGLDSSTLLALLNQLDIPVNTYTISLSSAEFDESRLALSIAEKFNSRHRNVPLATKDIETTANNIANIFDEPYSDPSLIPTAFLYTQVDGQSILAGDGGDELLGGYPKYVAHRHAEKYRRIPKFIRRLFLNRVVRATAQKRIPDATPGKVNEFIKSVDLPLPVRNQEWICQFQREEICRMMSTPEPSDLFAPAHNYAGDFDGTDPAERAMYIDIKLNLVDQYNMKVDASSRFSNKSADCPLLHKDLFEFAAKLPANFKVNDNTTKLILRQLDKKYLPDNIVNKPKTGFGIPLHEILQTELAELIDVTLRQDRLNEIGIADYDFVRRIVNDDMSKKKDLSKKIWCLFTLLKWAEERKAFCERQ